MKPKSIDVILIFGLTTTLIVVGYMYNQKLVELERNKKLIQDTFNPVMEYIQYSNFSVNGKDMGYGQNISDHNLPGIDCDRRVREALYSYLEDTK
jgi:hypothetical protein